MSYQINQNDTNKLVFEGEYDSKLDLMRAYAKEASFLHIDDIIDDDMAAIIKKEQDEGLFEEDEE